MNVRDQILFLHRKSEILFSLRDDFTDTRAPGAVDGTPPTPGPGGPRVGVDTNNKMSIGSGVLDISPHSTPATGDPGIWYSAQTRIAGLLILGKMIFIDTDSLMFGFDSNQSGSINVNSFRKGTTTLQTRDGSINGPVVADISTATSYILCVILRSTGAYYFIKGGAFTNWTLLWMSSINNVASIFPASTVSNAANYTTDFIRIPLQEWLPTPIAYTTFTQSNGALLPTEATGPDGQQAPVKSWTNNVGTTAVVSNKIVTSALSGGIAISTIEAGTPEIDLGIDLVRGSATAGLTTNYVDVNNRIFAEHDGTNLTVVKVVAGTPTPLIDIAATYSAGAIVNVKTYISGGALKLRAFYNHKAVGTEQSISDAALISATKHGWYSTDTDSTGDNLLLMARGQNDSNYSALNRFIT